VRKLPNTKNVPLWARFWCLAVQGGVVFVCARAGGDAQVGEEDAEQSKCGTFWVFSVRGVLGGVCMCQQDGGGGGAL